MLREVWPFVDAKSQAGQPVVLARLVTRNGTGSRPLGSTIAVATDGTWRGSVSGGCVEPDVIGAARSVLNGAAVEPPTPNGFAGLKEQLACIDLSAALIMLRWPRLATTAGQDANSLLNACQQHLADDGSTIVVTAPIAGAAGTSYGEHERVLMPAAEAAGLRHLPRAVAVEMTGIASTPSGPRGAGVSAHGRHLGGHRHRGRATMISG